MESSNYDLCSDLTETILSRLPINSVVRAASVCKFWRAIVASSAFAARFSAANRQHPWFFISCQNNISLRKNRAFGFDPESNRWIVLSELFPATFQLITGCDGFLFAVSPENFRFRPVLRGPWRHLRKLRFSRRDPLVGVLGSGGFIVVGGIEFSGGLVDIEDNLAVEIYDSVSDSWELCPPLPAEFRNRNSSESLCSAMFNGKFYVLGIYSCFVSYFDLENRHWSSVQTLKPPGLISSFLISSNDCLILAGLCNLPSFNLWIIDEETMEFSEMAIMPPELLLFLIQGDESDGVSLKCVGLGNLVYVFNEHHQNFPGCVFEINKQESGKCYGAWRKLPGLPSFDGNMFHKVVSFCSSVSLDNVFEH